MNLTAKRESIRRFYHPFAYFLFKLRFTPNTITSLSLIFGSASALAYYYGNLLTGVFLLLLSGLLDLLDGEVARFRDHPTKFGAVYDWLVDKWVDGLILGIIGYIYAGPAWATFVVTLSMLHSFVKPVVYAEVGFEAKINGKIRDPMEGLGFFGRPETHLTLIIFTIFEKSHLPLGLNYGIKLITILTALSLLQRILYLYKNLGKVKDD
ncbi:MAG: CDP-alcohol phosphatidyltransferase family protein [Caldimicrobium sp.]|nr:CDP-alcohol phosphatidyltransferase family protein [Caldimicrobium sp.]MCX7873489.1 CDP-alcohol phosphatidyltransferase family protein [Caldimicrobium sp.]MDW8093815.1 CDP-alcohol phosphatidyltransferase family protein [Caldimicrobium sp.]